MIRHHFTLEHLAAALNSSLNGSTLVEAYSQEKDTCVFVFYKDSKTLYVNVSAEHAYGTVEIVDVMHRARKNTTDIFPGCLGKICTGVHKVLNDRILSFWFDTCMINVYLFSGGSGNVVVSSGGVVVDALSDKALLKGTVIAPSEHVPQLGKWYQAELERSPDILNQCKTTDVFYVLTRQNDILFSLVPLTGWTIEVATKNIFEAIHRVISTRRNIDVVNAYKKQLTSKRKQDLLRLQRSIQGIVEQEGADERAQQYRMFGDLLLATPTPARSGETSITLQGHDGKDVTIPLDKNKTMVENANHYYVKAKKSEKAALTSQAKLPILTKRMRLIEQELELIESSNNAKELEKLLRNTEKKMSEPATKFREFQLEEGYILYVGRNAGNNDELTMKFAKANDLWFHARGVSGSHAVLKMPEGTTKPPKKVLEAAASAAAYYSGARNAKYVPVVYTQKKYVRKFKGANLGAVTLERETVIMVPPALPSSGE